MKNRFRLQIISRETDKVVQTFYKSTMEEIEEIIEDFFYTDGELNLRNIHFYYNVGRLSDDGDTYSHVKVGD